MRECEPVSSSAALLLHHTTNPLERPTRDGRPPDRVSGPAAPPTSAASDAEPGTPVRHGPARPRRRLALVGRSAPPSQGRLEQQRLPRKSLFSSFSECERAEGWRSMTASLRPRWGRTRRTRRAPLPGGPCWAELPYMYAAELCLPRRPATTTETATRTGQSTLLSSHSNQASEGVQPSPIMNGNMARLLLTARILHPIQLALDERV